MRRICEIILLLFAIICINILANGVKVHALGSKLLPRICIDTPQNNATASGTSTWVKGWSLNASGVKQVIIYVDGKYNGNASIGQARTDVNLVYPGYPGGSNSGYSYKLDTSKLTGGQHTLTVMSIGKDRSSIKQYIRIKVNKPKPAPRICIDTPQNNATVGGTSTWVKGWSLNASGVKQVVIYVDGKYNGNASIGQARTDVNRVYPGYPGGSNSGYSYKLDISKLTGGQHTLTVMSIGKDGSSIKQYIRIKVNKPKPAPRICIDTPQNNATVGGTSTWVKGWSLNASGVKQVVIYVDGKYNGNASIGQARTDVNRVYPGYPGGSNSGYSYKLDISKLTGGQHTLTVMSIGKDGSSIKQYIRIKVNKPKPAPRICIDTPQNNATVSGTSTWVKGWSLNASGVKQVVIYVDGKYKGNASIGQARTDVNLVYPGYPGGSNSGYSYKLDTSKLTGGQHTLTVMSIGKDGSSIKQTISIKVKINDKIIAIDIGHNAPYDSGATGIKQEDTITKDVGQRVINQLESSGYNVISTKPSTASSTLDSLQQRVDAANNAHADVFISIHANLGGGNGTEVWIGGSSKSRELGQNIENNMIALGYRNRGIKVQGINGSHLYVLNNTYMPAVLVETCFIDSREDMNRYNPDAIAKAIVKGIISSL